MIRIEIRDFQSIESVVLDVDGFAALVGRSNIGKSAVIRAVRAVLTNAQGTRNVRHGLSCARRLKGIKTCGCRASVRLQGSGYDILWEKGDGASRYTVNGVVYEAVPKGFPEFLRPWFCPVRVSDESVMLQVADQFDPMFLLGASGPAVADVFSDVAKLDAINVASRFAEKDRREIAATIKVRDKDIQRLRMDLEGYSGLDDAVRQLERLTGESVGLTGNRGRVAQLRKYVQTAQGIQEQISSLSAVGARRAPSTAGVKDKTVAWERLLRWQRGLSARQVAVVELQTLGGAIAPPTPGLEASLKAVGALLDWLARLRQIKASFARLTPALASVVPVADGLLSKHARLTALAPLAGRLEAGRVAVLQLEQERALLAAEEIRLHGDITACGTCPVCDRPLEPIFTGQENEVP